ncbi:MAG TPA: hypothetical protein VEQ61_10510, partial [Thermoleophilaceae bacterium]|nr:hypothetical protein [Thermoleophilaceae bacterium]
MLRAERLAAILLALLVLLLPAGAAKAAEESGDAGPLPGSAQDLGQSADLSGIDGALESAGDVDVYRVCLSAGSAFSADTVGGSEVDTQLFLLDEAGLGVYSNDDATAAARQSLLPAGDPLTPANGGVYHLAISGFDLQPFSAGGAIFPNSTLAVAGPTGEGGAQPVERWSGRAGTPGGAYRIALSGVERCPRPDASPPTIDLRSPADGAVVARGNQVMVDYSCADEPGGSGLARCEGTVAMGGHLDTTTLGPGTFTVSASDAAGNTASVSHSYTVVDREDPTVTIRSPLDGAIYLIGQE